MWQYWRYTASFCFVLNSFSNIFYIKIIPGRYLCLRKHSHILWPGLIRIMFSQYLILEERKIIYYQCNVPRNDGNILNDCLMPKNINWISTLEFEGNQFPSYSRKLGAVRTLKYIFYAFVKIKTFKSLTPTK